MLSSRLSNTKFPLTYTLVVSIPTDTKASLKDGVRKLK